MGLLFYLIYSHLFDLFVNRMLITVGTELFQLHPICGIPAVLLGGVAGNPRRALGQIAPTLGTLYRNDDANALILSHDSVEVVNKRGDLNPVLGKNQTQLLMFS